MPCYFLLCSKVCQPYIYTRPLPFGLPPHPGHHSAVSRVPCAIEHVFISSLFHTWSYLSFLLISIQFSVQFNSFHSLSCVWPFATPQTAAHQASVHHQFPEFTQTHVHWVGDAIQLSHPLSSPPSPTFNLSQYQGLFKWVSSSHQVTKVLEFQLQHQSFQWIFRIDFL